MRIVAYRPLLFGAIYVALGLLIGYFIYSGKTAELVISLVLFSILPLLLIIYHFIIRPMPQSLNLGVAKFFRTISKHSRLIIILSLCAVLGFSLFNIGESRYSDNRIESAQGYLSGTVTKSIVDKQNYLTFYLRDCAIYLSDGSIKKLDGITRVFSNVTKGNLPQNIEFGTKMGFNTTIFAPSLLKDNGDIDSFNYKFDIKYECSLKESAKDSIVMCSGSATIAETVNDYVLKMLLDSMDKENALLAWSVLFGDSTQLSDDALEAFKVSGVMHIIAVSGMNVVFIVAIILGFLSLIRVKNKKIQFIVNLIILLVYCWLCAFTPSVVRASIMALVFLFARSFGYNGDILSNIAFSAILILVVSPLMLFEPGFLLSYGSLLGIILLNAPIYKVLRAMHLPKFLSLSISSTISAQLGIYPLLASTFGYFSTYSFIANIVIVPIFEFSYIILFVLVIATSILPFLSALFPVLEIAFNFINWFPTLFVDLPQSVLIVFKMGLFVIAYFLFLIFLSQFIFIKKKWKATICGFFAIIFTFGVISSYFSNYQKDYYSLSTYRAYSVLLYNNEQTTLVGFGGDYKDIISISNELNSHKIFSLNNAVLWQESSETKIDVANFMALTTKFNVQNILISEQYANDYSLVDWFNDNNLSYSIILKNTFVEYSDYKYFIYFVDTAQAMIVCNNEKSYIFYSSKQAYKNSSQSVLSLAKSNCNGIIYQFYSNVVETTK